MKAKYVKPMLIMERFEMTQAIATNCNADPNSTLGDPNTWTKDVCGWVVGTDILWEVEPKCNWVMGPEETYEGLCYNNPDGGTTIFGS